MVRKAGFSLASLCGYAGWFQSGKSLWLGRLVPVLPVSVVGQAGKHA